MRGVSRCSRPSCARSPLRVACALLGLCARVRVRYLSGSGLEAGDARAGCYSSASKSRAGAGVVLVEVVSNVCS